MIASHCAVPLQARSYFEDPRPSSAPSPTTGPLDLLYYSCAQSIRLINLQIVWLCTKVQAIVPAGEGGFGELRVRGTRGTVVKEEQCRDSESFKVVRQTKILKLKTPDLNPNPISKVKGVQCSLC